MSRLLRTLVDIGPRRLQRRLRYELRQRFDRRLPPSMALALAGAGGATPPWRPVPLATGDIAPVPSPTAPGLPPAMTFNFLNDERCLPWPITWNDPSWPRLWQFNLHYFDWASQWLEHFLNTGSWPEEAVSLELLIDHWIEVNPAGRGDGWHSYTLSLRTRNWICLFRTCPALVSPSRLQSLWQQLCWLQAHPEHCHGGNHWLENLTALAIGGLQFDGSQAAAMHRRALDLLQPELASQLLADGGHEERSAGYHLLMLERLVELSSALQASGAEISAWLTRSIEVMLAWADSVRLEDGGFPRFNDSVIENLLPSTSPCAASPLTDLASTGWTLIRPGHGWELVFKCGVPCPRHLPPHAHSDLLSFDLFHQGVAVLAETGTSVYGSGPDRLYERSGAAHNVLQLGSITGSQINWIEPVEVWGGFRAGRKANPLDRACGQNDSGSFWVSGSHDGFKRFAASHRRHIELSVESEGLLLLSLRDQLSCSRPMAWRQWWHLGPDLPQDLLDPLLQQLGRNGPVEVSWQNTWFSTGFGQRRPRLSLCFSGQFPPGEYELVKQLSLRPVQLCSSPLPAAPDAPSLAG